MIWMARHGTLLARLNTTVLILSVAVAAYAVAIGQWWWAAAAAFVVVGHQTRPPVLWLSLVVAVVVHAWPAAVCAGLAVALDLPGRLPSGLTRLRPRALDEQALATRIADLRPDLRRRLESEGPRVDTAVLVRVAGDADPDRWPTAVGSTPNNSEGGLVAGTRWTVIAAEAALVAARRPDTASAADIHLLAAIAVELPHSLARKVIGSPEHPGAVLTAAGLTASQVAAMIIWALKQPGAELLLARMEYAGRNRQRAKAARHPLDEQTWRLLSRKSGGHEIQ
jgi:hypothetical protein